PGQQAIKREAEGGIQRLDDGHPTAARWRWGHAATDERLDRYQRNMLAAPGYHSKQPSRDVGRCGGGLGVGHYLRDDAAGQQHQLLLQRHNHTSDTRSDARIALRHRSLSAQAILKLTTGTVAVKWSASTPANCSGVPSRVTAPVARAQLGM